MAETPEGASAFARYYLGVVNRGFASGDAAGVRALSDEGCGSCQNLIGAILAPRDPAEAVRGGDYAVEEVASALDKPTAATVLITYKLAEATVLRDDKIVRTVRPQGPITATMELDRRARAWIVTSFTNVGS